MHTFRRRDKNDSGIWRPGISNAWKKHRGFQDTLQQLFVEAGEDYRNMCVWFHEGLGKKPRPADEFFGHWHTFFQGVRAALEGLYGGRTKRRKAARSKILRPYDQFRQSLSLKEPLKE
ncbi:unnamed protein product [Durusdinium trenchii]|uniref:Uncharacterized protein n=2 Tax=Durusdinium trenchii TaxID=1381693 RepID=A0ABP0PAA0_9DINO